MRTGRAKRPWLRNLGRGLASGPAMIRPFLARVTPLAFCAAILLHAGCGGTDSMTSPTPSGTPPSSTPPPAPSPTPSPSPSPSPGPTSCPTGVTGLPSNVPDAERRYTFTVEALSNCTWAARVDVGWANIAPGSGQGNGSMVLAVEQNTSRDSRTVTVTVNSQSVRVIQDPPRCLYTVSPTNLDVNSDTNNASIVVTTTLSGCPWTATASESWLRAVPSSGNTSATITVEIGTNPGDVRHAFLTIAGQRVNVTQQKR